MNTLQNQALKKRRANHAISPHIVGRWSPRAMIGDPIPDDKLMMLFEAARWAPSCYNEQPWRFIYAKRDTEHWDKLYDLLVDFNAKWCEDAAVLVVIISSKHFAKNNKPNRTHSYDAGAAWQNLALQGADMGLVVHGMAGFDYAKAKQDLGIPDNFEVEAMCAIGILADKESLPKEMQEKETPSSRKPVEELIMEGKFRA